MVNNSEPEMNPNFTDKAVRDYKLVQIALGKTEAEKDMQRKAYGQLMENYKDALYYMLLKMTNSSDDAEDLTIEAFGKAFKRLSQYTDEYAFSTWLFKIATNNCIDYLRKKKKSVPIYDRVYYGDEETDEDDPTINVQAAELNPEDSLIREQKIQTMRIIVDKLKPRYRSLIELRYFQEMSYEEISEQLRLPIGTVKAQLFRAREFLQNILKNNNNMI